MCETMYVPGAGKERHVRRHYRRTVQDDRRERKGHRLEIQATERAEEGGGVWRRWASGEGVRMVRKLKVRFTETEAAKRYSQTL